MKISFHGAVRQVTGSCFMLQTRDIQGKEYNLLIDCGMYQGQSECDNYNYEDFGFDPQNIHCVFITHAHADHTCRLPKLVKEGFTGNIYLTQSCFELTKLIIDDAKNIMEENAKACAQDFLFEQIDVDRVYEQTQFVQYHEPIVIAPGITVEFFNAGHILGSAFICITSENKKIIFSGDIGNDNVPILPDTEHIESADIVVCESTYGNRIHEDFGERSRKLRECIENTIKNNSVLMIPAFSIERTQELLYEFDRMLQKDLKTRIPIYLDSPMAIRATSIYRKYKDSLEFDVPILEEPDQDFFSFSNLTETLSSGASKHINNVPGPKIIIAGSGMMSGGRILHHASRYLPNSNNTLLIIGYQADNTIGRQIIEGAKAVDIFGKMVDVKATVKAIGAFSAHGDKNKLTKWLRPDDNKEPQKVFLVHGDEDAKLDFAAHLKTQLQSEIIIPALSEKFEI
ncbi:MAG: MBL fold metallo-hydrolase [Patescibacteria group bacterium]